MNTTTNTVAEPRIVVTAELRKLARKLADNLIVRLQADKMRLSKISELRRDVERMTRAQLNSTSLGERITVVAEEVAKEFSIHLSDLFGRSKFECITTPRNVLYMLSHELTGASLNQIGEIIDKRTHGTLVHGIDFVKNKIKISAPFAVRVEQVRIASKVRLDAMNRPQKIAVLISDVQSSLRNMERTA